MWVFLIDRYTNHLHLALSITRVKFNSYELNKLIYYCLNFWFSIKTRRAEKLVVVDQD
jgi:hypothetical protein